jgi:hypothetical protein
MIILVYAAIIINLIIKIKHIWNMFFLLYNNICEVNYESNIS